MLHSWEIAAFREHLLRDAPGDLHGNYRFQRRRVAAPIASPVPDLSVVEDALAVEFRKPEGLFGAPQIGSCLDGVADSQIQLAPSGFNRVRKGCIMGLDAVMDEADRLFSPHHIGTERMLEAALVRNAINAEGYVLLRDATGGVSSCFFRADRPRSRRQTAFFVCNLEIGNYGSFLVRALPQLVMAAKAGLGFDCYVVSDRSPWLFQALDLLHLPKRPIFTVDEVCGDTFEHVVMANVCDTEGLFSPLTLAALEEFVSIAEARSEKGTKIYVSRTLSRVGLPHYRLLRNEDAVEELVTQAGYQVVYPETLSLVEQIRLFAAATRIVGPSGSGMLNAVFSRAGSKVLDIESFSVTVRQHAKVYSSTGKAYAFCFGYFDGSHPTPNVAPWSVDLDVLRSGLDWLSA